MTATVAPRAKHAFRIRGTPEEIEVGKILCLGRNYARHAREMGGAVPEEPIVFLKPATALLSGEGRILLPPDVGEAHHEVEIVVGMENDTRNVRPEEALDHVLGFGVGIDVTLRTLQTRARQKGEPWSISKGFDTSAAVSTLLPKSGVPDWRKLRIELRRNGSLEQVGRAEEMVFGIPEVISYLSRFFTLEGGDLIFMGTPEGVGPIRDGDLLEILLEPGTVRATFHVGESP